MNVTRADLEELRYSIRRIDLIAEQYQSVYCAMYDVIRNELTTCWIGEDMNSFLTNVESVRYRFEKMYEIMKSYKRFLEQVVANYEEQIRRAEEEARRLEEEARKAAEAAEQEAAQG